MDAEERWVGCLEVGEAKLDFAVEASGSEEGGVEGVGAVGGHEDFDVAAGVESVELGDNLEHRPLDFIVAIATIGVRARSTDRVHLVEKYDAGLFAPRQLKQFSHHSRPLTHVLLHQLGTDHTNKRRVRLVRDRPRQQRLPRPCPQQKKQRN